MVGVPINTLRHKDKPTNVPVEELRDFSPTREKNL